MLMHVTSALHEAGSYDACPLYLVSIRTGLGPDVGTKLYLGMLTWPYRKSLLIFLIILQSGWPT